jgi:VanZ family protein
VSSNATSSRSAVTLLLVAWTAVIVYASWFPFVGWHWPAGMDWLSLLRLPWPRGQSTFDIVSNLLGYMPLGALLVLAQLRQHDRGWRALRTAVIVAAALSYAMEVVQALLPQRVPSLLDWLLNTTGAAIGAAVGLWLERTGTLGWLHRTGEVWFVQRSRGGLALLLLWPLGLLFPTPVALGLGQVWERMRDLLNELFAGTPWGEPLTPWLDTGALHSARLAPTTEVIAVALGLVGPCLVTYSMAQPGLRRIWLALGATALGFGVTTLSTALNFGPQHALAWCTATTLGGLALGCALALAAIGCGRRTAAGIGLVAVTAGLVLVAQAPADPYYAQSLHKWEQGRFIRFHGLSQWIGWSWPYLATLWLLRQIAGRD